MDDEVGRLQSELDSPDVNVRNWAAVWAGNHGVAASPLLPKLLEMIEGKLNDSRPAFPCGEFVSVGRILRQLNSTVESSTAIGDESEIFASCFKQVRSYLEVATGASASLLIYILVLIGPSAADAAQLVLDVVERTGDERIRHRAFQFAYWVDRQLLERTPWNNFAPQDPLERSRWEVPPE